MVDIHADIAALSGLETQVLRDCWRQYYRVEPPPRLSRDLLIRGIAYKIQERARGGLTQSTKRKLRTLVGNLDAEGSVSIESGPSLKPGVKLVREWRNRAHTVTVLDEGFEYDGRRYRSLTRIAREITGARWSGPRFFGLKGERRSLE